MAIRTDLAMECKELVTEDIKDIEEYTKEYKDMTVHKLKIKSEAAAKKIGKGKGTFFTAQFPKLTDDFSAADTRLPVLASAISSLLPAHGLIMVAGVGNTEITADALGPISAGGVLATRHICGECSRSLGLENLRPVAVVSPGVLGQTGIETSELIAGVAKRIKPSAVIVIDSLAGRRTASLGCTLQISDTGISPGSGVGNHRTGIDRAALGVPVIGVGIPTVVYAATLAADLLHQTGDFFSPSSATDNSNDMLVTPREIDMLIKRGGKLISMAINLAVQPDFELQDILSLTN